MLSDMTILDEVPRWVVMWVLAGALFAIGKTALIWRTRLRGWKLVGFASGWVGMDTAPFKEGAKKSTEKLSWWHPLANLLFGSLVLWGAARHFSHPLAAGWVGMVGLIFVLHFGLFALLALVWKSLGIQVTPIMRCPIAAKLLSEFWGKRWNLAFRDMTHLLVFRPVTRRWGAKAALWAVFAASGLMHELVISVPAGAGYGLPMAYFLLQACGIMLERKMGPASWLRTHAFTVLPAYFLFHPPFVERVMIPFLHFIGALS